MNQTAPCFSSPRRSRKFSKSLLGYMLASAFIALCLITVILSGCSGDANQVATAPAATPVVDLSTNDLALVTAATRKAVSFDPALKPYVQTVANVVHAHATVAAPSPAIVSGGLSLLTAVVPGLNAVTGPVSDFYSSHYSTLAAAQSAEPLIEQLAAAIEAGAS